MSGAGSKLKKLGVGSLLSGLLAVFLFLPSACDTGPKPEDVVAAFLGNWANRDYVAMYALLDTSSREQFSEEYFLTRYDSIGRGIGLRSLEYEEPQVEKQDRQTARFSFTVVLDTYTVGPIPVQNVVTLTREERRDPWRISWDPSLIFPELTDRRRVLVSRQVPRRGEIRDRNGELLAGSRFFKEVGAVHGRYEDQDDFVNALASSLKLSPETLASKLNQPWVREGLFVPLAVLTKDQEELIPQLLEIKGVMINDVELRYYPAGTALSQVIGHLGEITAEELAEKREMGYYSADWVGKAGLERAMESLLAGEFGFTLKIIEEDGSVVALIAEKTARDGSNLSLTIDLLLQQAAEDALGDRRGAVVVMDPVTGEILVLANKPGFDPNLFIAGMTAERWRELVDDPGRPMLNRALSGLYPPGSVFKVYTAAVALEEQKLDPEEKVRIEGDRWQPSAAWGGYKVERVHTALTELDLWEAMKYSDNIYFARAGMTLGAELFEQYGVRFGFGETIPFTLPVATSRLAREEIRSEIQLADSSFGQGEILISPLHMSLIYCAVAGSGDMPAPKLLKSEAEAKKAWREAVFSPNTARTIHRALVYTVHGKNAPAAAGAVEGITVAGKTGTAQVDTMEGNVCWYITYAPADDPRVLVTVVVEEGTWAGVDALPVARAVLKRFLELSRFQ